MGRRQQFFGKRKLVIFQKQTAGDESIVDVQVDDVSAWVETIIVLNAPLALMLGRPSGKETELRDDGIESASILGSN